MSASSQSSGTNYLRLTGLTVTSAICFCAWVKVNSWAKHTYGTPMEMGAGASGPSRVSVAYQQDWDGAGTAQLMQFGWFNEPGGQSGSSPAGTPIVTDSRWMFVMMYLSGTSLTIWYGEEMGALSSYTATTAFSASAIQDLYLGSDRFSTAGVGELAHASLRGARVWIDNATFNSTKATSERNSSTFAPVEATGLVSDTRTANGTSPETATSGTSWTRTGTFADDASNPSLGGGTNTPMTLTVTQTQTVSRVRVGALLRSVTTAQTPSRARVVVRSLSAVHQQLTGSAPTVTGIGLTLSAAQTQTPTRIRGLAAVRSAMQTQTPSRARSFARTLTVTVAQVVSMVKGQLGFKTISATASQVPSLRRDVGSRKSANQAQAASRSRAVGLVRAVAQTQAATSPIRAIARALSVVAAQVLSRARAVSRTLSATASSAPSLQQSSGGAGSMTLSVTSTQAPTAVRNVGRPLAGNQVQTPTRARALARLVAVVAAQVASVAKGAGHLINLTVTTVQTVTRSRGVAMGRATTQGQTATATRGLTQTLSATQGQAPVRVRALARVPLVATTSQTPSVTKGQGFFKTLTATISQSASRGRELQVARFATHTQGTLLSRALGIVRSVTQSQTLTRLRSVLRSLLGFSGQTPTSGQNQGASFDVLLEAEQTQTPSVEYVVTAAPLYKVAGPDRTATGRARKRTAYGKPRP